MLYFILLFILLALLLYKKTIALSKEFQLKELIAWCLTDSNREYLPLHQFILEAQNLLNVPPKYRIISSDLEKVKILIAGFQKDTTQKYFSNSLYLPKCKYTINSKTYFMYLLQSFLEKHQCDSYFLDYNMHQNRITYESYGSWGGELYDATYSLTDFAIVFHKLYYIAYIYCKKSNTLNPKGNYFNNEQSIEYILDSKQISISQI